MSGPCSGRCCGHSAAMTGRSVWCPRPESNRHDRSRGIFLPLWLSPPVRWTVWGLEHAFTIPRRGAGARRLLSTPSRKVSGLGSALARRSSRAFAEFDGFHSAGFPTDAQNFQVPCVYQFHHSGDTSRITPHYGQVSEMFVSTITLPLSHCPPLATVSGNKYDGRTGRRLAPHPHLF